MKVKVFKGVDEDPIQRWLDEVGDIYITGMATSDQNLVVFYVDRRSDGRCKGGSRYPFRPSHKAPREVHCPKCNSLMNIRANGGSGDLFWGCSKYPDCKGSRRLSDADWEAIGVSGHSGEPNGTEHRDPPDDDIPF